MKWREHPDFDGTCRAICHSMHPRDVDAAEARVVRRAMVPPGVVRDAAVWLCLMILAGITLLAGWLWSGTPDAYSIVLIVVAPSILIKVVTRRLRGEQARDVMFAWLRLGRCPACAYRIAAVPRGEDGAVTCPECGARWGLPWTVETALSKAK